MQGIKGEGIASILEPEGKINQEGPIEINLEKINQGLPFLVGIIQAQGEGCVIIVGAEAAISINYGASANHPGLNAGHGKAEVKTGACDARAELHPLAFGAAVVFACLTGVYALLYSTVAI